MTIEHLYQFIVIAAAILFSEWVTKKLWGKGL